MVECDLGAGAFLFFSGFWVQRPFAVGELMG